MADDVVYCVGVSAALLPAKHSCHLPCPDMAAFEVEDENFAERGLSHIAKLKSQLRQRKQADKAADNKRITRKRLAVSGRKLRVGHEQVG